MMRGPERPGSHEGGPLRQSSAGGIDSGGFQRLGDGHFRQNGGQPLGQHAFSGAGSPKQQEVMSPSRGHLHRPFGHSLPPDLRKIRYKGGGERIKLGLGSGLEPSLPRQEIHQIRHVGHSVGVQFGHGGSLGGVAYRHESPLESARPGSAQQHGKDAAGMV